MASTGQRLLSTLQHCAALVRQAEEGRGARLRAEKERCRVLEEALAVLAAEHHDLEQSFQEQISENKVELFNFGVSIIGTSMSSLCQILKANIIFTFVQIETFS